MANEIKPEFSYAHAIYSDDVRFEIGGKTTIVGIYNSDLYISEFPAFIPKLVVTFFVCTPIEKPADSITIRVSKGEETLVEFEFSREAQAPARSIATTPVARAPGHDASTRFTITHHVGLPALTLTEPCTLRTCITVNGETFNAGKLHIGRPPTIADAMSAH